MSKNTKVLLLTGFILTIVYVAMLPSASAGYGHMGYYGYHRGPSFWYFGGPSTYYDRNVRAGSHSGVGMRGRGPGSGK